MGLAIMSSCQYCARELRNRAQHERSCAFRPEIKARILEIIQDENGTLYLKEYNAIALQKGLPGLDWIKVNFGTYANFCRAMGIPEPDPERGKVKQCPYCQKGIWHSMYSQHIEKCGRRPEIFAKLKAIVADPERPGYAIAYDSYNAISAANGLPGRSSVDFTFGSWRLMLDALGLKPVRDEYTRDGAYAKGGLFDSGRSREEIQAARINNISLDAITDPELDCRASAIRIVTPDDEALIASVPPEVKARTYDGLPVLKVYSPLNDKRLYFAIR